MVEAGAQQQALTDALEGLGVGYQAFPAGELVVVVPDRNVTPDEVPNEARAPAGSEPAPPPGHTY